jgi:alpha-beta hydrolase superfamily lysophospholipase
MQTVKNIYNKKTPLFFSEIERFIQSLPPRLSLNQTQTNNRDLNSGINSFLNSYLNHYNIDFVNTHIAKKYFLWASTFNVSPLHTDPHAKITLPHYRIVQHYWKTENKYNEASEEKSKGTVVIVHGYLDHTGLYGRAIQWALTQGYDVLSFDLPGHGLSSGDPASIINFDTYSEILDDIIRQNQHTLTKPLIALGQSTGCAIICHSLLAKKNTVTSSLAEENPPIKESAPDRPFTQAILLAPLVRSQHWRWLRYIYFLLRPTVYSIQRNFVRSSHHQAFNQFIKNADPLQASRIPLLWLGAMEQWYQTIQYSSQTCDLPLTIIQGTGDTTVDWRYNIPALSRIFTHSHSYFIQDAQHHLVNESPEYWHKVETFLTQQLKIP